MAGKGRRGRRLRKAAEKRLQRDNELTLLLVESGWKKGQESWMTTYKGEVIYMTLRQAAKLQYRINHREAVDG